MFFKELKNKKWKEINLNNEAKKWILDNKIDNSKKPLINPNKCQKMVQDVTRKNKIDFSFGGYLENREFLWKGSYLDKDKTYIHLGIDFNAPRGSKVSTGFEAEVVRVDCDYPTDGGWGSRVIVKCKNHPYYFLFEHLDKKIMCKVGDIIKKDTTFAKVGYAPYNVNWFDHLHVQVITKRYFNFLEKNNAFDIFDGYCSKKDIKKSKENFPNPIKILKYINNSQS